MISIKYGHMQTKDGHYIGSSWIKHDNKTSRNNYCIAVNFFKYYLYLHLH